MLNSIPDDKIIPMLIAVGNLRTGTKGSEFRETQLKTERS